jgi:hypothetical protein
VLANPAHVPSQIAGKRARPAARKFAPKHQRMVACAIGTARQPAAIGFKMANASHVPNTNSKIAS